MTSTKWDGVTRREAEWDGLRRDPELWYPDGNCLVYLYERGQSRRGPAFKIPLDALLQSNCRPLLDRFLTGSRGGSPFEANDDCHSSHANHGVYELYIPAPKGVEHGEAFLYHIATRNFFAWVARKSLVGSHLGGALVGLLSSMNEFRRTGQDNVQDIIDYMDDEGYADMRDAPNYALAVLYFAEHFHFKDMWIDAFAHCAGMNERLIFCPGFEFMNRKTRALVTRARFEMDARLDDCGSRLSTFLSDEVSYAKIGLSSDARAHLDKFQCFLHSYYVAQLGYYPTKCVVGNSFPKHVYAQMCTEFQMLYEYLVDTSLTDKDSVIFEQQGGICVWQNVQAFDRRHKHRPLKHPFPLLPGVEGRRKSSLKKRLSMALIKEDKKKLDPRLITLANLVKATNGHDQRLRHCKLVRAYKRFEKDSVLQSTKGEKNEKLSLQDARKIRWTLIYSILQTLLSATRVPQEVTDTHNVPYNICVTLAGCPPWTEGFPYETPLRTQTNQAKEDFRATMERLPADSVRSSQIELKSDIDYLPVIHPRQKSNVILPSVTSVRRRAVGQALCTLHDVPELSYPMPQRASFHEITVDGNGDGTVDLSDTKSVSITTVRNNLEDHTRSPSPSVLSGGDASPSWSETFKCANDSPMTSPYSSRPGSITSIEVWKPRKLRKSMKNFLDIPMTVLGFTKKPSSVFSVMYDEDNAYMKVTTEVMVEGEEPDL